jgi:hypothetical protein
MTADKLVEAFVVRNSTPQAQIECFLRNANDNDKFFTELTSTVFRLPEKERKFKDLEGELAPMFMKKLGLLGTASAIFAGMFDKSGPYEGVKKALIYRACIKMGFISPIC